LEGLGMENVGIFFGHLEYRYITAIWYILRPFGNVVAIWYIFSRFGILLVKIWQPCSHQATFDVEKLMKIGLWLFGIRPILPKVTNIGFHLL
jgi:hypothetical protein